MASYPVLGTGPVTYLDANQSQHSIPLSAITISNGTASASQWPGWLASPDQQLITALLAQLVNQGLLQPGAVLPQLPITITAAVTGPVGNVITVAFSNPNTAASPQTVDVQVTATQVNANLTLTGATGLGALLGNSLANSTGLVYLSGAVGNMPAALATTPFSGQTLDIMDAGSTPKVSFTLAAAVGAPMNLSVTVTNLTATTFTLTTMWSHSVNSVSLATLTGAANPFAALVNFAAPPNGQSAALPGAGSVTLTGGAPASTVAAVSAAAVAPSA